MQLNYPSIKRLMSVLDIDRETAVLVRNLLTHKDYPEEVCKATADWCYQCYHHPSRVELVIHAIDMIINNYGLSSLAHRDEFQAYVVYSDPGDLNDPTIYFHEGRYKLGPIVHLIENDQ